MRVIGEREERWISWRLCRKLIKRKESFLNRENIKVRRRDKHVIVVERMAM